MNSAFDYSTGRTPNIVDTSPETGWFSRTFDPQGFQAQINTAVSNADKRFNAYEAQKTREFNSREAQIQRDFEERMSNTAYQRSVADAKKAGLNPYVALHSGASTPQGVAATGSSAYANSSSSVGSKRGAVEEFANTALKLAAILAK